MNMDLFRAKIKSCRKKFFNLKDLIQLIILTQFKMEVLIRLKNQDTKNKSKIYNNNW